MQWRRPSDVGLVTLLLLACAAAPAAPQVLLLERAVPLAASTRGGLPPGLPPAAARLPPPEQWLRRNRAVSATWCRCRQLQSPLPTKLAPHCCRPPQADPLRLPQAGRPDCRWHGVDERRGITSWEFQLRIDTVRVGPGGAACHCSPAAVPGPTLLRRSPPAALPPAGAQRDAAARRVGGVCGAQLCRGCAPPARLPLRTRLSPHDGAPHGAGPALAGCCLRPGTPADGPRRQPSSSCACAPTPQIWHEVERAVATDDGRPLDPEAAGTAYPFSQIGVLRCAAAALPACRQQPRAAACGGCPHASPLLPPCRLPPPRLRQCLAVDAAAPGTREHLLRPGESDLTLKLKGVDPEALPDWGDGAPVCGQVVPACVTCCCSISLQS